MDQVAGGMQIGLAFLLGGLCGAVINHFWSGSGREVQRLREELREAYEDADRYRGEVTAHFEKTSALFEDVTSRYRNLYDHLSRGATAFCDGIQHNPRLKFGGAAQLPGESVTLAEDAVALQATLEGRKVPDPSVDHAAPAPQKPIVEPVAKAEPKRASEAKSAPAPGTPDSQPQAAANDPLAAKRAVLLKAAEARIAAKKAAMQQRLAEEGQMRKTAAVAEPLSAAKPATA
jgi:uncharacterized membrane-anchored protein YhcB (DUF1043 family)